MRIATVWIGVLLLAAGGRSQDIPGASGIALALKYPFFEVGETVSFTLKNGTALPIYPAEDPGFTIMKGKKIVFTLNDCTFCKGYELKAGKSQTLLWNQESNAGNQVPPGIYAVVRTGSKLGCGSFSVATPFEIVPKTSGSVVFNTTQDEYTSIKYPDGKPVKLFVINKSAVPAFRTYASPWSVYHHGGLFGWFREKVYNARTQPVYPITISGAGGRVLWTWGQRDQNGGIVDPGDYTVRLQIYTGEYVELTTFTKHFRVTTP